MLVNPATPPTPDEDDEPVEIMLAPAEVEPEVRREAERMRIRREARRLDDSEQAVQIVDELSPPITGADLVKMDLPEEHYLVDDLWPYNGNAILVAPDKSGKSTMVGNVVRCLLDGDAFLGEFGTTPVDRVVLIDNELSLGQLQRWTQKQRIQNLGGLQVESLRGRLGTFNLANPQLFDYWVERLRGNDVLILDCLRPALDGCGLSEDKEAGLFLRTMLASLATQAGIQHMLVAHHTGHDASRPRGDSAIKDWPDSKWVIHKNGGDHGQREFSSFGREVDFKKRALGFDPATLHLSLTTGEAATETQEERQATSQSNFDRFLKWLERQDPDAEWMTSRNKSRAKYRDEDPAVNVIGDQKSGAAFRAWEKRTQRDNE